MIDWLSIGIRFALYLNLMLLFGLPLFSLYSLKGSERLYGSVLPFRSIVIGLATLGTGLSLLSIVAMTASIMKMSPFAVDRASISVMIFETPMGHAWQVRIVALTFTLLAATTLGLRKTAKWQFLVLPGSAAALASLAWTGHGATSEGAPGTWHLIADIAHLFAAGAWVGALAALGAMLIRPARGMSEEHLQLTHRALAEFPFTGTVIVAVIVASGLVNSWMLIGPDQIQLLPVSLYGQLLSAKLVLFCGMLGLASANRFRMTPAFNQAIQSGGTAAAIRLLRLSLITESCAALTILGLVAWLGTLQPPT